MNKEEKKIFRQAERDILQRDPEWENSLSRTDRLALAYLRLRHFPVHRWDEEILGPSPQKISVSHAHAIQDIIGRAEISRFEKMEVCGWTYDEWFRWYTVERVIEEEKEESQRYKQIRKENRILAVIDILLMIVAAVIAFRVILPLFLRLLTP